MGIDEILAALRNRSLSIEEALRQDAITPIVYYEFAYRSVESALLQAMEYGYDVQNELPSPLIDLRFSLSRCKSWQFWLRFSFLFLIH